MLMLATVEVRCRGQVLLIVAERKGRFEDPPTVSC